jgi:hypothetical protein
MEVFAQIMGQYGLTRRSEFYKIGKAVDYIGGLYYGKKRLQGDEP